MTQPHTPPSPRRTNAEYRWTRAKVHAFVDALVRTGGVAAAAREVGMSRNSAYRLRARLGPGFAQVWDEGLFLARRAGKVTVQGDTCPAQGDTFSPQGGTFGPQGDTSAL